MRSTVLPSSLSRDRGFFGDRLIGGAGRAQRDRALAGARVALQRDAPRHLVILGVRHDRPDRIPRRLIRTRDEQRMAAADNFRRDRRDLFRRLSEAEDDFGEALPDDAMVIDLGKPKILKGLVAKRRQDPLMGASPGRCVRRAPDREARNSASVMPLSSVFR